MSYGFVTKKDKLARLGYVDEQDFLRDKEQRRVELLLKQRDKERLATLNKAAGKEIGLTKSEIDSLISNKKKSKDSSNKKKSPNFASQLKEYRSFIQNNSSQNQPVQRQQSYPQTRMPFQADPSSMPKTTNFFEHRDPIEIYGDDGLTLFDSGKKARNINSTGSMFGL